ncbi:MAG: serine--tRNA ligase [Sphingobacteriia bacterium]|nr:serine--tRNA ligase [Sphingobacteriia bacterium]
MLTFVQLRQHTETVIRGLEKKNIKQAEEKVQAILAADDQRKHFQKEADDLKAKINSLSKSVGQLMRQGETAEVEQLKTQILELKNLEKSLESDLKNATQHLNDLLLLLPNIPHHSVPAGTDADHNQVMRTAGHIPVLHALAKPHWELAKTYDIIDFELGVKLTGAGFPVYKGKGAILQRALITFFLQEAQLAGYTEIQPPILVNADSGFGTGQLPDKDGQMYFANADGYYLIPTAEVPITNIYRDVILQAAELPIKNCGYTPCFRREAGSYGKDVRGLNRLHQFDKVEIVQIAHPEKSYTILEDMVGHVSSLLDKLHLPYRILKLCGGDMSFASALTYDFEVYSAAQQRWLEVSSVSNFETFQTNRLKCRYKDQNGKTQLAHSLNGSALALPRIVAALLENNQTPEGITIPQILHALTGFKTIS